MRTKEDVIRIAVEISSQINLFDQVEINSFESNEVLIYSESKGILKAIMLRFKISNLSGIEYWMRFDEIEHIVEPIAIKNGIKYSFKNQHTLANSIKNKELVNSILFEKLDNEELKTRMLEYFSSEIQPFFRNTESLSGLESFILKHNFGDLINIGIGGEYPINILKAIAVAKLCKNEPKYVEYKNGLQKWIDEDKNDPNYAKMYDTYQNSLNQLIERLENQS